MTNDFRLNLYPTALSRIKRLERALVRDLRRAQSGLITQLRSRRGRSRFTNTDGTLAARMKAILLNYARSAFAEGAHVAAHRMRQDKVTFNTTPQPDTEETELHDLPDAWAEWYGRTLDESLAAYTDRIRTQIGNLTQQAAGEGWTPDELTGKIGDLCDGLATWQAERIARTEIMKLWNIGHTAQFAESEELAGYEYSVVMDDRTSHYCTPLAGVKVRRDDVEFVPPLHPHCRTILEPVYAFDDVAKWTDGSRIRPAKGFGVTPDLMGG